MSNIYKLKSQKITVSISMDHVKLQSVKQIMLLDIIHPAVYACIMYAMYVDQWNYYAAFVGTG